MDTLSIRLASLIVFTLGASIGSFINVVVYRLPSGLSLLWPPSRCPCCLKHIKPYDNVPVVGWLWLKGRCRVCKSPISLRYPLVEATTGLLFLLIFWTFKFSLLTVGYWLLCSWLLTLSLIDWDTMTLPNILTQSGLVLGIVFQLVVGSTLETGWIEPVHRLMTSVMGAVLGLWLFDAIALIGLIVFGKTAMGGGDAKLAAMIGAWLGWKNLLLASFIACGIGALVGYSAIILSQRKWGQKIPFGPFLALGAIITIFSGEAVLSAYLRLFMPGS